MEERVNSHICGVVNQIALTGTITHLHLWWQQPGRRAKEGWFCVSWGSGSESTILCSKTASCGSHPHLNLVCICYNWSQLLPKLETFLFWGKFLLIWNWCVCFVYVFGFPLSLLLHNSCIKYPRTPLLGLNKQKSVLLKIQEDMMGEVFISKVSGDFYLLCPKI